MLFLSLKASALAKECSQFLEEVEQGCYSASTLSTLQMYVERFSCEFSTPHFQALKAKACAVGSGASGVIRVWNAAWVQCQEVGQRLEAIQKKKKDVDKNQIQQTTAVNPKGEDGVEEKRSGEGEDECTLTKQLTPQKEAVKISIGDDESNTAVCIHDHLKPDLKESIKEEFQEQKLPEAAVQNEKITTQNSGCHRESKWRPREHHSEADLRSANSVDGGDDFSLHQPLGRSLSEGSCVSSHLKSFSSFSPLNVRNKHCQSKTQTLEQSLQPVQSLPSSHNESLRLGNLSCESKGSSNEEESERCTVSTQSPKDLRTPETLLTPTENNSSKVL